MLYAALAFFVVSLVLLVLGFTGVIRGAAGIANLTFMASLLLLAVSGLTAVWRRQLHHHHTDGRDERARAAAGRRSVECAT